MSKQTETAKPQPTPTSQTSNGKPTPVQFSDWASI